VDPARPIRRGSPEESRIPVGVLLGVALVIVIFVEVLLGVTKGLDRGHLLLALGLALDAAARALGVVAACQSDSPGWAWASALGGSPFAVAFASVRSDGPPKAEPWPAASLIASVGGLAVLAAGTGAALGI
jgi:hypothetical protein